MSQLCKDFEDVSLNRSNKETGIKHHHAELPHLQERFLTDKEKLRKSIISQGNPFSTSKTKLINIYSHEEAPSSEVVYELEKMGSTQYNNYVNDVFMDASQAIYIPIKQNNVRLFDEKNVTSNKTTCKLSTAKVCNKVITKLFIASHQRNADLDNLFRHEISLPPPSFYAAGEVNICSTKSKLLDCLLTDYIILPFNINCQAILVDGSSVAQSHKPK